MSSLLNHWPADVISLCVCAFDGVVWVLHENYQELLLGKNLRSKRPGGLLLRPDELATSHFSDAEAMLLCLFSSFMNSFGGGIVASFVIHALRRINRKKADSQLGFLEAVSPFRDTFMFSCFVSAALCAMWFHHLALEQFVKSYEWHGLSVFNGAALVCYGVSGCLKAFDSFIAIQDGNVGGQAGSYDSESKEESSPTNSEDSNSSTVCHPNLRRAIAAVIFGKYRSHRNTKKDDDLHRTAGSNGNPNEDSSAKIVRVSMRNRLLYFLKGFLLLKILALCTHSYLSGGSSIRNYAIFGSKPSIASCFPIYFLSSLVMDFTLPKYTFLLPYILTVGTLAFELDSGASPIKFVQGLYKTEL